MRRFSRRLIFNDIAFAQKRDCSWKEPMAKGVVARKRSLGLHCLVFPFSVFSILHTIGLYTTGWS
jgi:hypothetical protein